MTSTPKTLAFDAVEWRDLCLHNCQRLGQFLGSFAQPTEHDVAAIGEHLDRMKLFALAWSRAALPPGQRPAPPTQPAVVVQPRPTPHQNGTAAVAIPKKRGRPKKIVEQLVTQ